MSTRTFLIIPRSGGKIREIHVSFNVVFFLLAFMVAGFGALCFIGLQWKNDRNHEQQITGLKARNAQLESRYVRLKSKVSLLHRRLEEIRAQENEIFQTAGLSPKPSSGMNRLYSIISFVTSPFIPRHNATVDELLSDAEETVEYYERLVERIESEPDEYERIPSQWPCGEQFRFVSFNFGERKDPFTGRVLPHLGIDIPAPRGTPVYAAAKGVVRLAEKNKHFGLLVKIEHNHNFTTVYAHLNSLKVSAGKTVRKGQLIGEVGSTGISTGPHLHYEILLKGAHQDPEEYFFPAGPRSSVL